MAKNKVEIDVVINGKMQKATVDAKKLGKQLDGVSNSAHSADRRLKGASRQSSSGTKNFSKMAQGITGGLVPAYAVLASTLFAVSAAFNFLKNAGQLRTLQAGQIAYSSATGTGMRTLTNDIIAAADGMLTFQDAAQAASIGISSGLSVSQLERMGKAAKDVSVVLGRDVTDSFNRLVRGATKAEPELLDELGIILRLDDAAERYRQTTGQLGKELSTFERQQAVTNFVLEESERKYGGILAIVKVTPNAYAQLGKAFDDILNKVKNVIGGGLEPLARILTRVPELAIAAFGLLGASIAKSIIPGLATIGTSSKASFTAAANATKLATDKLVAYNRALKAGRGDKAAGKALGAMSGAGIQSTLKSTGQKFTGSYAQAMKDPSKLSKRQIQVMVRDYEKGTGQMMMLSKKQKTALILDLKDLEVANKITQGKVATDTQIAHNRMAISYRKLQLGASAAFNAIKVGAAAAGRAMGFLMASLGWISLAVTGALMLKDLFFKTKALSEEEEAAKQTKEKLAEKLKSLAVEYSHLSEVMAHHRKESFLTKESMSVLGNSIASVGGDELKKLANDLAAFNKKAAEHAAFVPEFAYRRAKSGMHTELTQTNKADEPLQDNPEAVAAGKHFQKLKSAFRSLDNEVLNSSKIMQGYMAAIGGTDADAILVHTERVKHLAGVYSAAGLAAKDNSISFKSALSDLFPESKYDKLHKALREEQALLLEMAKDAKKLSKEDRERLTLIRKQAILMKSMAVAKHRELMAQKMLNTAFLEESRGRTPLQKERLSQLYKINQLTLQIKNSEEASHNISKEMRMGGERDLVADQRALDIQNSKTQNLEAQKTLLEDQLDLVKQMNQSFKDGFEGSTTSGINDLLTGKTSSGTDAALGSVKGGLESQAKTLSKEMSRGITGFLFGDKAATQTMSTEDIMQKVLDGDALRVRIAGGIAEGQTTVSGAVLQGSSTTTDPSKQGNAGLLGAVSDKLQGPVDSLKSHFTDFGSQFKGILGTNGGGFLTGLGNMFSNFGTGFSGMLSNLLGGGGGSDSGVISMIISSVASAYAPGAGAGAGAGAAPGSMGYADFGAGFANGGISKGSKAGYTALLHGTEAIVPLPDGNKIPVEMKGGAGATITNNISVNISKEGSSTTDTSSSGGESKGNDEALAKALSQAVQEELVKQKRPGGLLSPYGAM